MKTAVILEECLLLKTDGPWVMATVELGEKTIPNERKLCITNTIRHCTDLVLNIFHNRYSTLQASAELIRHFTLHDCEVDCCILILRFLFPF